MKTVYIHDDTHLAVKKAAPDRGMTISQMADSILRAALIKKPLKGKPAKIKYS